MGYSLKKVVKHCGYNDLVKFVDVYKEKKYLVVPHIKKKVIYVALQKGESSQDVISAYYNATLLAVAISYYNGIPLVSTEINLKPLQDMKQFMHVEGF